MQPVRLCGHLWLEAQEPTALTGWERHLLHGRSSSSFPGSAVLHLVLLTTIPPSGLGDAARQGYRLETSRWDDGAGRSLSPPGYRRLPPRAVCSSQLVAVLSSESLEKSQP